jgi:hypothetical protein
VFPENKGHADPTADAQDRGDSKAKDPSHFSFPLSPDFFDILI